MKLIFSILLSLISLNLSSQLMIDTEYFYLKVVFDDLPIYDEEGKEISSQELLQILYKKSPGSIHWGAEGQEYFTDLISNFLIPTDYRYYKINSHLKFRESIQPEMTEIYTSVYNVETGEFIEDRTLFLIDTKFLNDLEKIHVRRNNNKEIEKLLGEWTIYEIQYYETEIELDYCFEKYGLKFLERQKYSQGYSNAAKCGLLDLNKSDYKHQLSYPKGFWKVIDNQIIFTDRNFTNLKKWKFEIENGSLKLIYEKDYIITLKKK